MKAARNSILATQWKFLETALFRKIWNAWLLSTTLFKQSVQEKSH